MFIKVGEAAGPSTAFEFITPDEALEPKVVSERFVKFLERFKSAADKRTIKGTPVAPYRSDDFLYFRTVIMHAAERANLDKTGALVGDGKFVITKDGEKEIWHWTSNKGIYPYANANGDIFPEDELIKAADTWVGKGLYCNHQSNDVEKLRGIIIDTVYDKASKELWGLVALDKKSFPILASQVKNGTIRNVSMGTAVKRSYCTLCGNMAVVEADYCDCIKKGLKNKIINNTLVGEINVGLTGVELSLVGMPADKDATIRHVYASLQAQLEEINAGLSSESSDDGLRKVAELKEQIDAVERTIQCDKEKKSIGGIKMLTVEEREKRAADRRRILTAYMQGTTEPKPGQVNYPPESTNMDLRGEELAKAKKEENETAPRMGDKGTDQKTRADLQRAVAERKMNREKIRQAYMQGTTEPTPGGQYTPEPMSVDVRNEELTKAKGEEKATEAAIGSTGTIKEKLQRASYLGARFVYAKDDDGTVIPEQSYWAVYATDEPKAEFTEDNSILTVTADEAYGSDLYKIAKDDEGKDDTKGRTNWQFMASKAYGNELVSFIKDAGIDTVLATFKTAAEPPFASGLETSPPPVTESEPGKDELAEPGTEPGLPGDGKDKEEGEGEEEPDEGLIENKDDAGEAISHVEEILGKVKDFVVDRLSSPDFDATEADHAVGLAEEGKGLVDKSKAPEEAGGALASEIQDFVKRAETFLEAKKKAPKCKKCDKNHFPFQKCLTDEKDEKEDKKKGKKEDKKEDKKKGKKKEAAATGKEVKDILAPANQGTAAKDPTGKDVKDIGDIVSPLTSQSVDSDNVGGQDMHIESKPEQHEKDQAAATSVPTGRVGSKTFAQKVGATIQVEQLKREKDLAVAKMRRSYDLASTLAGKGHISDTEIRKKADEFYDLPDDAFISVKRIIEAMPNAQGTVKVASAIASLGNVNGENTLSGVPPAGEKSLTEKLSGIFTVRGPKIRFK